MVEYAIQGLRASPLSSKFAKQPHSRSRTCVDLKQFTKEEPQSNFVSRKTIVTTTARTRSQRLKRITKTVMSIIFRAERAKKVVVGTSRVIKRRQTTVAIGE